MGERGAVAKRFDMNGSFLVRVIVVASIVGMAIALVYVVGAH
jgi:phage shock protein PspC (stress-responsive transcriptional regulator)